MKKQVPINLCSDKTVFTVTTRVSSASVGNLTRGGGHYPSTGFIVIGDVNKNKTDSFQPR